MNKRIIIIASVFGFLAVGFGAFGAHGLKKLISTSDLEIWKTAVDYQFYHTFALLFLSSCSRFKSRLINISSWCFTIGIILFSGSLYLLATKDILQVGSAAILGPITPLGGLFFLTGWLCLLIGTIKNR
ncbi:MAG: Membrane protein [Sphingobacteriales bacterium]|nr:Membrane protein [Sphingobacteriales bacterium]